MIWNYLLFFNLNIFMYSSVTCWNEKKKHILDVENASLESLTAYWVLGIFMVVG